MFVLNLVPKFSDNNDKHVEIQV